MNPFEFRNYSDYILALQAMTGEHDAHWLMTECSQYISRETWLKRRAEYESLQQILNRKKDKL